MTEPLRLACVLTLDLVNNMVQEAYEIMSEFVLSFLGCYKNHVTRFIA